MKIWGLALVIFFSGLGLLRAEEAYDQDMAHFKPEVGYDIFLGNATASDGKNAVDKSAPGSQQAWLKVSRSMNENVDWFVKTRYGTSREFKLNSFELGLDVILFTLSDRSNIPQSKIGFEVSLGGHTLNFSEYEQDANYEPLSYFYDGEGPIETMGAYVEVDTESQTHFVGIKAIRLNFGAIMLQSAGAFHSNRRPMPLNEGGGELNYFATGGGVSASF